MSSIKYVDGSATGNTFLLVDCLHGAFSPRVRFKMTALFLARKCDSCLVIQNALVPNTSTGDDVLHVTMTCYFPKGGFCANGARFLCWYLHHTYLSYSSYHLHVANHNPLGLVQAGAQNIVINLPQPVFKGKVVLEDTTFVYLSILDEPHMLSQVDSICNENLCYLAEKLQQLPIVSDGVNVSLFVTATDGNTFVKTWERGIRRITKSCGTASICCGYLSNTSKIQTLGGTIHLNPLSGPL